MADGSASLQFFRGWLTAEETDLAADACETFSSVGLQLEVISIPLL